MIIKKLNSVCHKHSRVLWGIITVIIIIAFVGFFTPGQFGFGDFGPDGIRVGTAFGKKVTYGELRTLANQLQILSFGRRTDFTERQLFEYYCQLAKAESMGLAVSDKEVAAVLRQVPEFQENGKFSITKYRDLLKRFRVEEADFNAAFRNQILLNKLRLSMVSGITATPGEVQEMYRQMNTGYLVNIAEFPAAKYLASVKVTAAGTKEYFEKNRNRYLLPGSFEALVVEFPNRNYVQEAGKLATSNALEQYYRANSAKFVDKDGKARTYAAAEKDVRSEFVKAASRDLARRAAYKFATDVYEPIQEAAPQQRTALFLASAAKAKVAVIRTGKVNFDANAAGTVKSRQLVIDLASTPAGRLASESSDEQAAYIGFVTARTEPRQAEFFEVSRKVQADYSMTLAKKAAFDAASKAQAALMAEKAIPTRIKAFKTLKGCTFKSVTFKPSDEKLDQNSAVAAMSAMQLATGEVGKPLADGNGAAIVLLEKRIPADMAGFAKEKDQYTFGCRMAKYQQAEQKLMYDIASQCRFELNDRR